MFSHVAVNLRSLFKMFTPHVFIVCVWLSSAGYCLGVSTEAIGAQGDISTVAGSARGDGGLATNASVSPRGVAFDAAGNMYIVGKDDHRVRKVAFGTGIITTIAGNGKIDFSGDGGSAINASFDNPEGIALDNTGNIYIADTGNKRIRKIAVATGLITTVAGGGVGMSIGDNGLATSATLSFPTSVAVDNSGNLYVTDDNNSRIRKIVMGTGIISTIAGTGISGFSTDGSLAINAAISGPQAVSLDRLGNVYFIDSGNSRVRKISSATGLLSTVAGGLAGFSGDGGPALDAGIAINYPTGLALDNLGNIYFSDSGSNRVRKVNSNTGIITTVAGSAGGLGFAGDGGAATSASLLGPSGIALDTSGNLYIVDTFNNRVRKVDVSTHVITTVAGSIGVLGDNGPATIAQLYSLTDVSVDVAGNIYFSDLNRIRKVTAATGIVTTVAGTGEYFFSGDNGLATSASFTRPGGIAVDAEGNIFIADSNVGRIRKVTASTGIVTTIAGGGAELGDYGLATNALLTFPKDVALDAQGNLYIVEIGSSQRIRKVSKATGVITTIAGAGFSAEDGILATSASMNTPYGIALDGVGNVYISVAGESRVRKITVSTGLINTIAGTRERGFSGDYGLARNARLEEPGGLAIDGVGNIFIADRWSHRIRKVNSNNGVITTVAGNGSWTFSGDNGPAKNASLHYPEGIAVDKDGNLYIADSGNNRIRKVTGPTTDPVLQVITDLSADGKSDLILRNTATGQISASLMNGTTVTSNAELIGAGSGWTATHAADFNGDGRADILYRHTDGRVAMWLMNGTTLISGAGLLEANSGWTATHAADFNGDGKADILYRHTDGRVAMWLMNGTALISGAGLLNAGSGWTATHTADFDGDGKSDLLFSHTDGRVALWLMNGTALTSGAGLLEANSGWTATHAADFNGDGKADILYRHTDGRIAMWLMNGTTLTSGGGLLNAASGWTATHTADFNGDGKADILYRHTDGRIAMWLMNGTALTSGAGLLDANSGWRATHTGDFNGDGKADLVFQNTDGRIAMWLMNGTALISGAGITGTGSLAVVPPMP